MALFGNMSLVLKIPSDASFDPWTRNFSSIGKEDKGACNPPFFYADKDV